jgi:ssDNA thymidine ADP-ribosyltransferase, DarT
MANHYLKLNPANALIWRIVHRNNLPWILDNGLHCANSPMQAPDYMAIGNADLIDRRKHRKVPVAPGGTLADYVPFYFTPFSPMMYNIYTGRGEVPKRSNEEIYILVSSLPCVKSKGIRYVFTDRHAYPPLARYFNKIEHLSEIDWPLLQARNFKRNPDDPGQIERYQAEALVYGHLPIEALLGVICHTDAVKTVVESQMQERGLKLDIRAIPGWYF